VRGLRPDLLPGLTLLDFGRHESKKYKDALHRLTDIQHMKKMEEKL